MCYAVRLYKCNLLPIIHNSQLYKQYNNIILWPADAAVGAKALKHYCLYFFRL